MKNYWRKIIKALDNTEVVEIENKLICVCISILYYRDITYLHENLIG
jgi:hypothetical protein